MDAIEVDLVSNVLNLKKRQDYRKVAKEEIEI